MRTADNTSLEQNGQYAAFLRFNNFRRGRISESGCAAHSHPARRPEQTVSGATRTVVGVDTNRMKLYTFDPATQVKTAITDMSKANRYVAAARVNSRRPTFAIEDEDVAEAV